jgi:hypothetical protein
LTLCREFKFDAACRDDRVCWSVPRSGQSLANVPPAAQIVNANEGLATILCGNEVAALDRLVQRGSTDPGGSASLGDGQCKLFQDCLAIVGQFDSGGQARVRASDGKSI